MDETERVNQRAKNDTANYYRGLLRWNPGVVIAPGVVVPGPYWLPKPQPQPSAGSRLHASTQGMSMDEFEARLEFWDALPVRLLVDFGELEQ